MRLRVLLILLALAVLAVYLPVRGHEFIYFDDQDYIFNNPAVPHGLTWKGIVWAFTHHHANNWHPLTWISHMLDVQLFGFNAGAHHLVNVLFHTVNTVLVYYVLRRLTGQGWPSLLVAAWFGLHPLHVESVAWVAERKDVLSAFFWLLTMLAYARYAEKPDARRYLVTLGAFAAGLLAKPMMVTLPCALLLLDYWPLGRSGRGWVSLFTEKIPFFALSAGASLATILAQTPLESFADFPASARFGNAVLAYVAYLGKTVWPVDLVILYPYARQIDWVAVLLAFMVLAGITVAAWRFRRERPWLLTGWLWYLGTLVPVIGIVQVGGQAMADRYTYVPSIGIFAILAWGGLELASRWPAIRKPAVVTAMATMWLCAWVTHHQLGYWQNTLGLFEHAVKITGPNALVNENLGWDYLQLGQYEKAAGHYHQLVQVRANPVTLNHYGEALRLGGHPAEALVQFKRAIELDPTNPLSFNNQALALLELGSGDAALASIQQALHLDPDVADLYTTQGRILEQAGQAGEAMAAYQKSLQLDPGLARAHAALGRLLLRQQQVDEAEKHFAAATALNPRKPEYHYSLGMTMLTQGKLPLAAQEFLAVLELTPRHAAARDQLGRVLVRLGHPQEAITLYNEGLHEDTCSVPLLSGMAWLRATAPEAAARNGAEAVKLAERAVLMPGGEIAATLDVLAAAYAEAGRFGEAVLAERRALASKPDVRNLPAMEARLKLYEAGQPYRQK